MLNAVQFKTSWEGSGGDVEVTIGPRDYVDYEAKYQETMSAAVARESYTAWMFCIHSSLVRHKVIDLSFGDWLDLDPTFGALVVAQDIVPLEQEPPRGSSRASASRQESLPVSS